jgi:hypothetical protein
MYRIEVIPGEETVFRTIEELAIGIRNGVITPRARIFHQASQKWLPIGLHPHYKKALEMPLASASPAPVATTTPLPASSRQKSPPPPPPSPTQGHSPVRSPEPKPVPSSSPMATELKVAPKHPAADTIPAPKPSPIVAMQREVLRDLPVLLIPEPASQLARQPAPLPWQMPAPRVPEPEPSSRHPAPLAPRPFGQPWAAPQPDAHDPPARHPAPSQAVAAPPVAHQPVAHQPVAHRAAAQHPAATEHHSPPRPVAHHPAHHPHTEHAELHADDALLPRPTARRGQRMGGRPFMLLGAAAALVIGTHFVLTTIPSASADPVASAAPADGSEPVGASPEVAPATAEQPATARANSAPSMSRRDAPRVTTAPARVAMTPGPAFAGSVPARPGADSMAAAKAAATLTAPPSDAAEEPSSIAPAPAAGKLAVPDLPPGSVVGTRRIGDTLAMKKILRAINGDQASEASPAP